MPHRGGGGGGQGEGGSSKEIASTFSLYHYGFFNMCTCSTKDLSCCFLLGV